MSNLILKEMMMTIATIEISPVTGATCIVQKDYGCSETWDTFDMLRASGFSNNHVGCYGGYEDCIVFHKDESNQRNAETDEQLEQEIDDDEDE